MLISDYLIIPRSADHTLAVQDYPLVSFCIPTKNRERTIAACLSSIRAQLYPRFEIVVVDNGSTDRTVAIARQYADVVTSCPGPLGAVRQCSIDASRGSIVALIDDDIQLPHAGWLMHAVAAFQIDPRASTVWPVLIPPPRAGWVTRCFFDLNEAIFLARRERPTAVFGGGNSLFLRQAIAAIGGFNVQIGFGEDFDLAARLKTAGYRVILHTDPLIHDTMYSLGEIYRKQQWGAAAIRQHGAALLAQSYNDAAYEQFLVGLKAMVNGLVFEHKPWWLTYPLLVTAKTVPYAQAIVMRELSLRTRRQR